MGELRLSSVSRQEKQNLISIFQAGTKFEVKLCEQKISESRVKILLQSGDENFTEIKDLRVILIKTEEEERLHNGCATQSSVHLVHLPHVPHTAGPQTGRKSEVVLVHRVHPPMALRLHTPHLPGLLYDLPLSNQP